MAERTHPNTVRDNRHPKKNFQPRISLNDTRFDDVIASLANARENRRARQVGEWERVGFRNLYRVA